MTLKSSQASLRAVFQRSAQLIGAVVLGTYARLKFLFGRSATAAELRHQEKEKQREIRRKLRGLEPEPVPPK